MRNSRQWMVPVLASGVLIVVASLGAGAHEASLNEVPESVKRVAIEAVPGIRLVDVEVEHSREGLIYELEGLADGARYEIEVSEDGEVLEVELEDDERIALDRLPRPVLAAAEDALPGARLVEAEIVGAGDRVAYEIEAIHDGREFEILITPGGEVLRTSSDDDSDSHSWDDSSDSHSKDDDSDSHSWGDSSDSHSKDDDSDSHSYGDSSDSHSKDDDSDSHSYGDSSDSDS